MGRELQGPEEGHKAKIHLIHSEQYLKKYQIGKRQAMMEYMDSSLKNSLLSMTDWISK